MQEKCESGYLDIRQKHDKIESNYDDIRKNCWILQEDKMRKRIFTVLMAVMMMTFGLSGCKKNVGTPEDNAKPQELKEEVESYCFGFSAITMENPYYAALESAVREAVENADSRLITKDPKLDSDTQIAQIDEMIEEGIQAIFLTPVDWEAIEPALQHLKEADVKIINVDTEVKNLKMADAYIGSDNVAAGALCGKQLVEDVPEGGKIAILECPTMNSINDRITGFETAVAEKGFEIVGRNDVRGDQQNAMTAAKELLAADEDITAIMCGNDQIALGALEAAKELNRTKVRIYSVDGSPDLKKELENPETLVAGTSGQAPIKMGKDAVETALLMMQGEDYEETTYEEVFFINQGNIDIYGTDGWQ